MALKMNNSEGWLRKRAEEEDEHTVSVGGFVTELTARMPQVEFVTHSAFSKLIELKRLSMGIAREDLAKRSQVDLEDVVRIEEGEEHVPSLRTVYQLANFLDLNVKSLMILAGLAAPADESFRTETVRFAAKSEPIRKLTKEERNALDEYVRYLGKR